MQPCVFLDRDNTLIANDGDLGEPDHVHLLDGVAKGLARLREAGFQLVVITNQGGVARGKFTEDDVDAVHQRIANLVDEQAGRGRVIDRFYYCPYHPDAAIEEYRRDHPWRKPHPGMLLQAARDMNLELSRSWMIGDQARDMEAGQRAGCRTVLVRRDGAHIDGDVEPFSTARSFSEAVEQVLAHRHDVWSPVRFHDETFDEGEEDEGLSAGSRGERTAMVHLAEPKPRTTSLTSSSGAAPDQRRSAVPREDEAEHALRRPLLELIEELRSERQRRAEFTMVRMAAALMQIFALLLGFLGLLQLSTFDAFVKWMIAAALVQLFVITLLLIDLKG